MRGDPVFEEFLQPAMRAKATAELATRGAGAIPVLEALFSGEAKNAFGVPYVKLGTPLDCALAAAGLLGPLAKPLEPHLREALLRGHIYAAHALGQLGSIEEATVLALSAKLSDPSRISWEAANVLARFGLRLHPSVLEAVRAFPQAERVVTAATASRPTATERPAIRTSG